MLKQKEFRGYVLVSTKNWRNNKVKKNNHQEEMFFFYCLEQVPPHIVSEFFCPLSILVYEELISKTSYIHSYMLLICSSGHSKEANFQHKIYDKWKMLILIEI